MNSIRLPLFARTRALLSTLAPLALLAACGGGGGRSAQAAAANLRITGVTIVSAQPTLAHELDLDTGIESVQTHQNVAVSYYLLHKGDVDARVAEPRQFLIDTHNHEEVQAGTRNYRATLIVPTDVDPRGDYYLVPRIDPLNQIAESDEDDNEPAADQIDVVIPVFDTNTNDPDFILEDLTLDDDVAVLFQQQAFRRIRTIDDVDNHHFSATALVQTLGAPQQPDVAFAVAITMPNGSEQALQIWNGDRSAYEEFHRVDLVPGIPNSIHLDVAVPEPLRLQLLAAVRGGRNPFEVVFRVNPGDRIPEWENGSQRYLQQREDDAIVESIVLLEPAPGAGSTQCQLWGEDFVQRFDNGFLGMAVEFGTFARLDGTGATAHAGAALPVKVFGSTLALFDFTADARVDPQTTANSRFRVAAEVLGIVVWERQSTAPAYEYRETPFRKEETVERKQVFFVGPVPLAVSAGATGTLGFDLQARLDTSGALVTASPFCDVSARAAAVVELAVARGGLAGGMTLINDTFAAAIEFGNLRAVNGNRQIAANLSMNVTNTLTGPRGRLYLFAEYPGVKFCDTFLGPVPCGLRTLRKEKTLVTFKTFVKHDVLFDRSTTLLVEVACQ